MMLIIQKNKLTFLIIRTKLNLKRIKETQKKRVSAILYRNS